MVDSSPVKGCMVIKPWGMAVWDGLKDALDKKIKKSGAQNAYFPYSSLDHSCPKKQNMWTDLRRSAPSSRTTA